MYTVTWSDRLKKNGEYDRRKRIDTVVGRSRLRLFLGQKPKKRKEGKERERKGAQNQQEQKHSMKPIIRTKHQEMQPWPGSMV